MVGVAVKMAEHQAKVTQYTGNLGILSEGEAQRFIAAYKFLQEFDYCVSQFVRDFLD